MTNEQAVVQIGRKRPVRELNQNTQNAAPPAPSPVSPAPVTLEEGRKVICAGLLVVAVAFGAGGYLVGGMVIWSVACRWLAPSSPPAW